jgi:hypothetical protein
MKRRLLNLLTALSLLLCAAVGAIWVRSRKRWEVAVFQTDSRTAWQFTSVRGRLGVERLTHENTLVLPVLGRRYFSGNPQWFFGSRNVAAVGLTPWESKGVLGFAAGESDWDLPKPVAGRWISGTDLQARVSVNTHFLTAPHPALIVLTAAPPMLWLWAWARRQDRARSGLCPTCGYDLRATPGRCPECGPPAYHATAAEQRVSQ